MQRCPKCGDTLEYTKNPPRFCPNCGKPLGPHEEATQPYSPPTGPATPRRDVPTLVPAAIGGYRLLRQLGEGGMGSVYEAEEIASGRHVAFKLIRPEFADNSAAIERFRREGRLAATIAHPRCVFVLAADEEEGCPYIVMELMPGRTLADLVEKSRPLSPREAVVRILDVIEGLQEAHRVGLVHRDVKPSNCFLDSEGRVKVGDFGLSKALAHDGRLTGSGAFLGTLLYAAPEQIRNDRVDHQADVYSVAATLYFLLTGRAPFQADDAAEALARTLTDPPTPMRKYRPDVPATLDQVVLRGLERDRGQRWQNLEELRQALRPFVRDQRSFAVLGWRLAAYLLDVAALFLLNSLLSIGGAALQPGDVEPRLYEEFIWLAFSALVLLLYFSASEWLLGGSPGKLLCRLRVRTALRNERPGLPRVLLRTTLFLLLYHSPSWLITGLMVAAMYFSGQESIELVMGLGLCSQPLAWAAGLALVNFTMRRSNGFRATHDFLTGTAVIRLPSVRRRLLPGTVAPPTPTPMPGGPSRLGPFALRGLLCETGDDQLLLGEDGGLNRRVWLWARPRAAVELPSARRDLDRAARPRWLAAGREGGRRWDAFVAAPGCPLTSLRPATERLEWAETLPVLESLTDELAAAIGDDTLPRLLCLEQVWVDEAGRLQLLDLPLRPSAAFSEDPSPDGRALSLLRQATAHMLEGRVREPGDDGPIRAPLPDRAAGVLRRLLAARDDRAAHPFTSVRSFRTALAKLREDPVEVTRPRRATHLLLLGLLLPIALFWVLGVSLSLTWTLSASNRAAQKHLEEAISLTAGDANVDTARLKEKQARLRRQHDTILQSYLPWLRPVLIQWMEMESPTPLPAPVDESPIERLPQLEQAADKELEAKPVDRDLALLFVLPVVLWPVVLSLWSGLTRGGLMLWLAGMRLVQRDGQRAARWRCAWRTLLASAPVAALLAVSLTVEVWRLTRGTADFPLWPAWVVWSSWWLGLVLLPLHAALALRSPGHGLLDRFAGTCLVPRTR